MNVGMRRVLARLERPGPPAYAQIEDRVAEAVARGDLTPGERLPPERELAERLGVSRMTLRQALDSLERRGVVERTVGRHGGTFVAEPKIERDLTSFSGLTHQLRRQGRHAGARVLSAAEVLATPPAAEALGVGPDETVFEIVRVRLSDDLPLALERSVFPTARFPGLLDHALEGSLYELIESRYGAHPQRAVERLEPVLAERGVAEALGVKPGSPLILVERTAYEADDTPLEWARDLFRGDRTRLVVEARLTR
ncbi:MAG TPA: GntR family transcriptional regulator [Actinomycetota bacterium]|jgi:GntR family transcriptional regulator